MRVVRLLGTKGSIVLRSALHKLGKALLRPIWARVSARLDNRVRPLEIKLAALEVKLCALSEREADHADVLYRRMYLAELEANHVPILDRQIKGLSERLAELESAWQQNAPAFGDAATLSNLPAGARKVHSELRAAIGARASND